MTNSKGFEPEWPVDHVGPPVDPRELVVGQHQPSVDRRELALRQHELPVDRRESSVDVIEPPLGPRELSGQRHGSLVTVTNWQGTLLSRRSTDLNCYGRVVSRLIAQNICRSTRHSRRIGPTTRRVSAENRQFDKNISPGTPHNRRRG